jgi:hypothetical protein
MIQGLFKNRIAAWAVFLAASVVGWFVNQGILTSEQAAESAGALSTALELLFAAFFGVVALIGGWVLRRLAGGNSGGGNSKTGGSGGSIPSIMITAAAFCLAGLALSSCSLSMTGDGCVLGTYTRNGKTYKAGPCVDANGKVDRLRVVWSNDAGQELRATIWPSAARKTLVEYHAGGGLWLQWTAKSGVSIGPVPPEVETALENETPLPTVEAAK